MKYKPFKTSQNQIRRQADASIRTIYDAAVEIITNSIDAYYSIDKKFGLIEIIYDKKNRKITFIDQASGMSYKKLMKSFEELGEYSAADPDSRGMHSRGAKDCKSVGVVEVHTIKDGRYSYVECHDDTSKGLGYEESDSDVTEEIRESYGIKENGTCVVIINTAENKDRYQFPVFDSFVQRLQNTFELFGCIDEKATTDGSKIICINAENNSKHILQYKEPSDFEIIKDEEFEIKEYKIKARFILKKAKNNTQRKIIIMSNERSAHEESFIDRGLNNNSYLENYYGELICSGINDLQRKYIIDARADSKKNPREIIDQSRRSGLDRSHPFFDKLTSFPIKILKEIIKQEEDKQRKEGTKTTQQLKLLEKEASKLLSDLLKENGPLPEGPNPGTFNGIRFFPQTGKSLLTNKKQKFTIWISSNHIDNKDNASLIVNKTDLAQYLSVDEEIILAPHSEYPNIYQGSFVIEPGDKEANGEIIFSEGNKVKSHLITCISEINTRNFSSDLEFEHDTYQIYDQINKKITLYAKSPELIDGRGLVKFSLNNKNVKFLSDNEMRISSKPRTNYASAQIELKSVHLNQNSILTAEVNGIKTKCYIETLEKQNSGPEIKWTEETLGGERYAWQDEFKVLKLSKQFILNKKLYNPDLSEQGKAWSVMYCDMLTDAFTEKLLDFTSKYNPEDLDIANGDDRYMIMTDVMNIYSIKRKNIHKTIIDKYIK